MAKYRYLLWDIDGTVLDFLAAEKAAMKSLFERFELGNCTDEMVKGYSEINARYWKALERGEITKPELLVERFREFFRTEGMFEAEPIAAKFNAAYQLALGDTIVFCEHSMELLTALKREYTLAAITNGTKIAQSKKLAKSGLVDVFDYIFISEDIGYEKPNIEFFHYVFQRMKLQDKGEVLVIGDSLTSDILGGVRAGVDTCWYNPTGKALDMELSPTYEIHSLQELESLL